MKELLNKIISYLPYDVQELVGLLKNSIISIPIMFIILRTGIVNEKYALYLMTGISTFITYMSFCEDQKKSLFDRLFFDVLGDLVICFIITLFYVLLPWTLVLYLILLIF
tara:strand:- start:86 stop:415 length:330 start_codon:yes stop_codon:yes gene_type:complete